MYDLLIQIDPTNWDKVIPDLAKSWKISENGLTYTFSLREGVKFHDGAPLTAEDVVASFKHIIAPPAGVLSPRQGLFDAVQDVVATDALTVEFRLTEPRGYLLRGIAAGFNVIMRKKTLEENNYDLRRVPVYPGTGPFRHKSLEPGIVRKLERNPDYWNPALPYLDGIEIYHLDVGPKTGLPAWPIPSTSAGPSTRLASKRPKISGGCIRPVSTRMRLTGCGSTSRRSLSTMCGCAGRCISCWTKRRSLTPCRRASPR